MTYSIDAPYYSVGIVKSQVNFSSFLLIMLFLVVNLWDPLNILSLVYIKQITNDR